jgi:hypothetical protein
VGVRYTAATPVIATHTPPGASSDNAGNAVTDRDRASRRSF